jgi:hypothetical protein
VELDGEDADCVVHCCENISNSHEGVRRVSWKRNHWLGETGGAECQRAHGRARCRLVKRSLQSFTAPGVQCCERRRQGDVVLYHRYWRVLQKRVDKNRAIVQAWKGDERIRGFAIEQGGWRRGVKRQWGEMRVGGDVGGGSDGG